MGVITYDHNVYKDHNNKKATINICTVIDLRPKSIVRPMIRNLTQVGSLKPPGAQAGGHFLI